MVSPLRERLTRATSSTYENPPDFLIEAHKRSLDIVQCNQYGPTGGLPRFTETLARIYSPLHNRTLDADSNISVHSGGTEALLSVITAFIEPGDEVVVFEPALIYMNYIHRYEPSQRMDFQIGRTERGSFTENEATRKPMLVRNEGLTVIFNGFQIVNTPHTLGKVFSAEELSIIGVEKDIIILADEVYEHLYYTPSMPLPRIAAINDNIARQTISIGSIGKAFNATGWRIGYAIGDKDLIRHVKNAHIILSYTTAGPAQVAAAVGLEEAERNGFWDRHRMAMKKKIHDLCAVFGAHFIMANASSIKIPANYIFPDNLSRKPKDWKLSWFLLRELGVATIPVDYLRFVISKPQAELELAHE
ncbi:hypothetical protein G7Y79_00034g069590 [Physcia stellaris]|nr:hypothetical protein G7Y79_00034g069590 [Physcia stellaris]